MAPVNTLPFSHFPKSDFLATILSLTSKSSAKSRMTLPRGGAACPALVSRITGVRGHGDERRPKRCNPTRPLVATSAMPAVGIPGVDRYEAMGPSAGRKMQPNMPRGWQTRTPAKASYYEPIGTLSARGVSSVLPRCSVGLCRGLRDMRGETHRFILTVFRRCLT